MNKIDAYKMDGLGNDFIIFDNRDKNISLSKDQIIKISDRKNIGCDQVIFINKSEKADANLIFYNSDGGEVGACGNGSRCVGYFLMKEKNNINISLHTKGGLLEATLIKDNLVNINIGKPNFNWEKIPLNKKIDHRNLKIKIRNKNNEELEGGFALSVGNPHIIFFVKNINDYDLKKIGPDIENHNYFPEKCNVTLAKLVKKNHIKIRVWERGAGITKACGTAACATAISSAFLKLTDRKVNIEFEEGLLNIEWKADDNVYMTGKVSEIKKIEVSF